MKNKVIKKVFFLLLISAPLTAIGDSSCNGGGTMYVCGRSQILQAVKDADQNCSTFSTKKLIDVCSPNMQEYTIHG